MRILMPVLIVCLLAGILPAQNIYVPANTPSAGSTNAIPFSPSFMKTNCGYQALYFAKYLKGQGWRLKDIAFAPTFSSFKAKQFQIQLGHNTSGVLTTVLANNLLNTVTVYQGPLNWVCKSGAWSTIGLQNNNFVYNGTDNIVLDLRYVQGSSGGGCKYDRGAIPRNWTYGTHKGTSPSGSDTTAGLKTRFTVEVITIAAAGSPAIGGTVDLNLSAPADAGLTYQVASSLGQGPIPLGTRNVPLSLDGLLQITVQGLVPGIFAQYAGKLDTKGAGVAKVILPKNTGLIGVRFYSAFLTLQASAPLGIKSISSNVLVTVTK